MTVCGGLFSFSFSGNPGAPLPVPSPAASPLFPALGTAGDDGPHHPTPLLPHTRRPHPLPAPRGKLCSPHPTPGRVGRGSAVWPPPLPLPHGPSLPGAEGQPSRFCPGKRAPSNRGASPGQAPGMRPSRAASPAQPGARLGAVSPGPGSRGRGPTLSSASVFVSTGAGSERPRARGGGRPATVARAPSGPQHAGRQEATWGLGRRDDEFLRPKGMKPQPLLVSATPTYDGQGTGKSPAISRPARRTAPDDRPANRLRARRPSTRLQAGPLRAGGRAVEQRTPHGPVAHSRNSAPEAVL
jgi:hypothetical protein